MHGEKSDLALGSGMFLVRLWWVGPGRGHMKGSRWQAAKDVQSKSNEVQNTWADLRTCHTLHKHKSYSAVDKLSIRLLFPKRWQSEKLDKHVWAVIKKQFYHHTDVKTSSHPRPDR